MSMFVKIVSWVLGIVALFVIISNGSAVNQILSTLSRGSIQGIAALQGKDVIGVTK